MPIYLALIAVGGFIGWGVADVVGGIVGASAGGWVGVKIMDHYN
jgi:hypothetical protein